MIYSQNKQPPALCMCLRSAVIVSIRSVVDSLHKVAVPKVTSRYLETNLNDGAQGTGNSNMYRSGETCNGDGY